MKPKAITPLFRLTEHRSHSGSLPGLRVHPAPEPGNHRAEMGFLGVATGLLTLTGIVPLTEPLGSWFFRVPVLVVLLFLVPQILMAVVSLVSPFWSGPRLKREAAQDWGCLAAMTLYAGWRCLGGGWGRPVCLAWLGFMGANLLVWLAMPSVRSQAENPEGQAAAE